MADTLPKIMVIESEHDWPATATVTVDHLNGDKSPILHKDATFSPTLDVSLSPTSSGPFGRPMSPISLDGTSARSNGRISPLKLIRNVSGSKDPNSSTPASPPTRRPSVAMNPLSEHILKRTNTENTIPQKLRGPVSTDPLSNDSNSIVTGDSGAGSFAPSSPARTDSGLAREKKKGVSFLSRLNLIGSKKKDQDDVDDDDDSEHEDKRTEGMNARVFTSEIDANGFIPQHKEPPRYIKVRSYHKKQREFNRMFLAQKLRGSGTGTSADSSSAATSVTKPPPSPSKSGRSGSAVWAVSFSKDGKYLAAAGRDMVVRVWAVISTAQERREHERQEEDACGSSERLSAPVFKNRPIREFEGHTSDVLDLSWSKNNFLLSSSMDKTVKLWHVSRQECLCTFKHKDFVTSIAFHPRDDRFFLAGSLDSTLRLWSIPDKSVAYSQQLTDLITAVAFTPDGKTCMAGVLSGMCHFYETEGLKYYSQIHVRSSRGKNAKGSKITGIQAITYPPDDPEGEVKLLITSNDSRIRLYNLRDKTLEMKFRGHENMCSQIRASFSDDAKYVICGSEDRKTYIWSTGPAEGDSKDKRPIEVFEAHSDIVTTGVFAPTKTKQLLGGSGDPIYDLCNPPPVTLRSREEASKSEDKSESDMTEIRRPEESPAYLARSKHEDGNIIITADHVGNIKVFRQDCAFQKRRNEMWETSSTFSRKLGGSVIGRSASILTRTSAGTHSRRGSISQTSIHAGLGPSDRIISWRNSVPSNVSVDSSRPGIQARPERSKSPHKSNRNSMPASSVTPPSVASMPNLAKTSSPSSTTNLAAASSSVSVPNPNVPASPNSTMNLAGSARQQPYEGVTKSNRPSSVSTVSPPPSIHMSSSNSASQPPTPGFNLQPAPEDNPLRLDPTGKSYQFWNISSWKNQFLGTKEGLKPPQPHDDNHLDPQSLRLSPQETRRSIVSRLSSEEPSAEESCGEDNEMTCKRCSAKDFRSKKVAGKGQKLVCGRCGLIVD